MAATYVGKSFRHLLITTTVFLKAREVSNYIHVGALNIFVQQLDKSYDKVAEFIFSIDTLILFLGVRFSLRNWTVFHKR